MLNAEDIIRLLNLKAHPEGGYYREIYRSEETMDQKSLPSRYSGPRCFSTGIYYLLTSDDRSMMHRVKSDETFHFYMGDPAEILKLYPDGTGEMMEIGIDLEKGMKPCVTIEKGVWQGQRLKEGGRFVLYGTTVSPGFEFEDFEFGDRESLQKEYPQFREKIEELTL
ncbi:MAG: cupin domain-containing protein [Bacteroidales bacterium]|nr:cupin domain-containing protein [Bacteroidales bacterium]